MTEVRTEWLVQVELEFIRRYGLNLEDLGWDESKRRRYSSYNLEPSEFVQWIGEKYGLSTRSSAYGLS